MRKRCQEELRAPIDSEFVFRSPRPMGHRNADRVPITERRGRCETVGDMIRQGWTVIAMCERCGLMLRVDLWLIAGIRGPNLSLWDRTSRCRKIGCSGEVVFLGDAPGGPGP